MADEVSAWEEYNGTAQSARPLPHRSSSVLRQRHRRSSGFRLSEVDNLLQFSKYFDEDELAIQEETSPEAEIPAIELLRDTVDSLQKKFAVFFEVVNSSPADNDKPSTLAWILGTVPWSTAYIQHTFAKMALLRQFALFVDLLPARCGASSPRVAIHGVVGLLVGNITAILFGFTRGLLGSGLCGYNALLVGLALATFAGEWFFAVFLAVVGASAISSVVFVVMGKLLVSYQSPPFTLPFNVATLFLLISSATSNHWSVGVNDPALQDYTDASTNLSAGEFFAGTIREFVSCLLWIRVWMSRGMVGWSTDGISAGLWGYNASLCAVMMIMFYLPSIGSALLAVLSVVTVVVVQQATVAFFSPFGLPAMTIPFCVVALLFMILQGTTSTIIAIPLATLTVPEDHLRRVQMLCRRFQSLKDALIDREDKTRESQFLSGSHRKEMQSLRSAIDAAAEQPDARAADATGKPIGANESTIIAADAIFSQLDGDLRLEEFIGLMEGAGLQESPGLQFAGAVFRLMDIDNSSTIDHEEFIALALVSRALLGIHRDMAIFFITVDADQSGAISFDELDGTGRFPVD